MIVRVLLDTAVGGVVRSAHAGDVSPAARIGGRCARLTVAAVAPGNALVALWAPLAGYDPASGRDDRIAEASRAAHRTVGLFPAHISVSHQSAACWRDVLRLIDPEAYDLIAVSGLPARRRDRRALRQAADRAGARMVYA